MNSRRYCWLACLFASGMVCAQEGEIDREKGKKGYDIVAIAGAAGNGVYVADALNGLSYLDKEVAPRRPRKLRLRGTVIDDMSPKGMSYDDPYLYIYDDGTHHVLRYNPHAPEERQRLEGRLENPSHIAVSPQGIVAILNGGELSIHQVDHPPQKYDGQVFPDASGIAFSTWSSLLVMSDQNLVRLDMTRQKDGTVEFVGKTEEEIKPPAKVEWEAMDVHEGVLHLATKHQIYARVDKQLIPILPQTAEFDDLDDFTIVRDAAYVLDDDDLYVVARGLPVDLVMEGTAAEGQAALLDMYTYLAARELLPVRRVPESRPGRAAPSVWFESGALITPLVRSPAPDSTSLPHVASASTRDLCEALRGRRALTLLTQACRRTPEMDAGRALFTVPDVRIERMLSQREVTFTDAAAFETHLEKNLPSEALRERVTLAMMQTLNPERKLTANYARELSGDIAVPTEVWSATVVVPADEFLDRDSDLWGLAKRHPTMTMLSRSAFVEQSAQAMEWQEDLAPPTPAPDAASACMKLQAEQKQLWDAIGYPYRVNPDGSLTGTALVDSAVRIGLIENDVTTRQEHYVFGNNPAVPVWYVFGPDFGFLVQNVASDPPPEQPALEAVPYSRDSHHGTHIAALLAGRPGPCWSGLLPRGELVLIDLGNANDTATLFRNLMSGLDRRVRVFNVSHQWDPGMQDLYGAIITKPRSLFVVGAGNDGKDLQSLHPSLRPVMAGWNNLPNVISVTASEWNGEVLKRGEQPHKDDANYGRENVDLIAPGWFIASAAEGGGFSRATGTSQAVPLVSAAAALLTDSNGGALTPGDARARLIATARWHDDYENKVWGGQLDFATAVSHVKEDRLATLTSHAQGIVRTIKITNEPVVKLSVRGSDYPRESAHMTDVPASIPFPAVLTIQREVDDRVRIVYLDTNERLKIVRGAILDEDSTERITCSRYARIDAATMAEIDEKDRYCDNGILVSSIHSYVRGAPYYVNWSEMRE